jgi:GT2 family glycosyltransferase
MTAATLTVTLGIVSHNRPAEVAEAVRSGQNQGFVQTVVVDSGSSPPLEPMPGTMHVRFDENIGASGGRNAIVENAEGDVVFFLDDDAVILPGAVGHVVSALAADPTVGAIATHLVRAHGDDERIEQPFRAGLTLPEGDTDCGYVITAGCAVRTEVYRAVGGSDARMRYGGDDIELSMRIQQAGYRIRWLHDARVEHRPSASGRMASGIKAGSHARARIWLARSFLPLPIAVIHAAAWILVTGREAAQARDLRVWARYVGEGLMWPVQRRRMTPIQLRRLYQVGGRVFF